MLNLESRVPDLTTEAVREILDGLPDAEGYRIVVKPLRYRTRPHLAAETDFDAKQIILRLPEPFLTFGDVVYFGAQRVGGSRMRFIWMSEGVTFRGPREVLRFLYCHEWMHWFLKERLGRKSSAETACDRFALRNYLRESVTIEDGRAALRRGPDEGVQPSPPR